MKSDDCNELMPQKYLYHTVEIENKLSEIKESKLCFTMSPSEMNDVMYIKQLNS